MKIGVAFDVQEEEFESQPHDIDMDIFDYRIKALEERMMRILFYGDSNTWGYNAQTGMRYANRFTKQIQKHFRKMKFWKKDSAAAHFVTVILTVWKKETVLKPFPWS